MAPRSRSSSESSHDSESPRKRAPSYSDAEGEIDAPGSPAVNNGLCSANEPLRVTPGCVHIEVLLGSTKLVHNYEKAVRWATRSRDNSRPPRKRRKACLHHHSFTLNDTRPYIYTNNIFRPSPRLASSVARHSTAPMSASIVNSLAVKLKVISTNTQLKLSTASVCRSCEREQRFTKYFRGGGSFGNGVLCGLCQLHSRRVFGEYTRERSVQDRKGGKCP
jgi:hypothetical protein